MLNQSQDDRFSRTPFFPSPEGCVQKDPGFARMLQECYVEELRAIAAASYRAMLCERISQAVSSLMLEMMQNAIAQFRFLGELILALGGSPCIHAQIRVDTKHRAGDTRTGEDQLLWELLQDAARDRRNSIDRYQSLLGRTQDRVVRSMLMQLILEEQRLSERVKKMLDQADKS